MNRYWHHQRLSSTSDISLGQLLPANTAHRSQDSGADVAESAGCGQPQTKGFFYMKHILITVASLICFAAAVLVVSPIPSFAWRLGFNIQIQIIGFLLGVMNLCTLSILPCALLTLEARFGPSRLQNYDALMRKDIWLSHTSWTWRVVLVLLNVLPLGLGVAYKRFSGGHSMAIVSPASLTNRTYGLSYPPLGSYAAMNNSIFEMLYSNAGFFEVSLNDDTATLQDKDFPKPLGFNMLLLQNDSAALLDIPTPSYLQQIQSRLRGRETWQISAQVQGIVARQNTTLARLLATNDTYFEARCKGFDVFYLYYGNKVLASSVLDTNDVFMLSIYAGSEVGLNYNGMVLGYPVDGHDASEFRARALTFDITRERCDGTWLITADNLTLVRGSCDASSSSSVNQSITKSYSPFNLDTMPILVHSLGQYGHPRQNSPWRLPAFATSAASAWWARASFMLAPGQGDTPKFQNLLAYASVEEKICSTVLTLNGRDSLLYLVLAIQPFLTISALFVIAALRSMPIGKGFNLTSVIGGINPKRLSILHGSALSGELRKPVNLNFEIDTPSMQGTDYDRIEAAGLRLRYALENGHVPAHVGRLRKGQKYG